MREGWSVVKLKDVCRLINGRAYKKNELLSSGPYPVLRVGNFFTNQSWYYSDLELSSEKYCENGDLLYAWSASFGPRIWEGGKVIFHYHIWKVDPNQSLIDKRFLYYWFDWDKEKIKEQQGAGTTMIHVTKGAMEMRSIALPPLAEQKRIVAILEEAFEGIDTAIANTEKNLANARELFDEFVTCSLTRVGQRWTTLGKLAEKMEYGSSAKSTNEGLVPVLRMGNIVRGRFSWCDLKYSSNPDEIGKYRLKYNDVLFNRTNSPELVGKTAIYKGEREAVFAGYLIRIHRNEDLLDPDFLCYFLNSSIATNHGRSVMSSSVNQANINATKLKAYPFPELSLREQQRLVSAFDEISAETQRLEFIYQGKLAALEELKQSLLQKAFSGELTPDKAAA